MTNVVVVGGGFAGVACAGRLAGKGIHVTLLDRNNYSQFQPLLYQVATAQLPVNEVARPLRETFRKRHTVDVKMADATSIDPRENVVSCSDGTTFSGDYIVLAMGSQPNFFSTPGADSNAFPLYSVLDAERLRSRVFEVFEDADRNVDLIEHGILNFVVVGAGATGVESAGALADLINDVMPERFHDISLEEARVYLIDPAPVVLAPFSDRAHAYGEKLLKKKRVHIELGVSAKQILADKVILSDGREIATRTVVWAGGIQAAPLAAHAGVPQGHGGRIDVEPDLTVKGFPKMYALGDVANTLDPDGKPFPQLGSVALQAGKCAADNIIADSAGKPRSPFHYRDKGIMAMIGRNAAVAEIGSSRRELHGPVAFLSWLGVHAWLLPGFRTRLTAIRSWTWDYLTRSRADSIIDRPEATWKGLASQ